jgi:hypothetical protein
MDRDVSSIADDAVIFSVKGKLGQIADFDTAKT